MRFNYTNALSELTEWAKNEGFSKISLDSEGISEIDWKKTLDYQPKHIKIQGKQPIEYKVYLMLHELGHHQLRKNKDKFEKVLPVTAYAEHIDFIKKVGKFKRRVTYTVSCVEEEFKAWEEGFKLAERFGIKINPTKWDELKASCLISYIRYYGAKK